MKRIKITVTKQDIAKGIRGSSISCPVAKAIRRMHLAKYVRVNSRIVLGDKEFEMPVSVDRFTDDFDDGKPVKPFSFTLPIE